MRSLSESILNIDNRISDAEIGAESYKNTVGVYFALRETHGNGCQFNLSGKL